MIPVDAVCESLMEMLFVAHAGHWLATLVYVIPLIAFALWMGFVVVRDRLNRRDEGT